jgi:putative acetyltransferase
MFVRPESGEDADAVRNVNLAAFPTAQEADLVKALHDERGCEIALVADDDGTIVGHVMLSRMNVEGDGRHYRALGLAPVAVVPERQGQGIGSALIEEGLRQARERGEEIVFLVGEPDYYRRFGFAAAAAEPFASPYAGPHFMAKAFVPLPRSGTAAYAPAFDNLS